MTQFARDLIREAKKMEDFRFLGITQQKRTPHYRLLFEDDETGEDFFVVVPFSPKSDGVVLNLLHTTIRKANQRRQRR